MIIMDKLKEILATWKEEIMNTPVFDREIYPEIKEQFIKPTPLVLHGLRRSGRNVEQNPCIT
jgi:hypothetical protein